MDNDYSNYETLGENYSACTLSTTTLPINLELQHSEHKAVPDSLSVVHDSGETTSAAESNYFCYEAAKMDDSESSPPGVRKSRSYVNTNKQGKGLSRSRANSYHALPSESKTDEALTQPYLTPTAAGLLDSLSPHESDYAGYGTMNTSYRSESLLLGSTLGSPASHRLTGSAAGVALGVSPQAPPTPKLVTFADGRPIRERCPTLQFADNSTSSPDMDNDGESDYLSYQSLGDFKSTGSIRHNSSVRSQTEQSTMNALPDIPNENYDTTGSAVARPLPAVALNLKRTSNPTTEALYRELEVEPNSNYESTYGQQRDRYVVLEASTNQPTYRATENRPLPSQSPYHILETGSDQIYIEANAHKDRYRMLEKSANQVDNDEGKLSQSFYLQPVV